MLLKVESAMCICTMCIAHACVYVTELYVHVYMCMFVCVCLDAWVYVGFTAPILVVSNCPKGCAPAGDRS